MAIDRQLSLVACYGAGQRDLAACVREVQAAIASRHPGFRPYAPGQVHATLIGLETATDGEGATCNRNFLHLRGERREADIAGFLASLRHGPALPLTVQIGGFSPRARPFTSRGRPPFERTFSIQGDKAVLIGWPVVESTAAQARQPGQPGQPGQPERPGCDPPAGRSYPPALHDLRRSAQAFGILHAWHRAPDDVDNDFYLRLGLFASPPAAEPRATIAAVVREALDRPTRVLVRADDLFVVDYRDETLPPRTTRACRLTDPGVDAFVARVGDPG